MKIFIKSFISLLSVFILIVLIYQGDFEYKDKFLNSERNTNSYKINISLCSDNEYMYNVLEKSLIKYNGDLFLNYYDSQKDIYYKYIYLSDMSYFENIRLKNGRYISLEEMNKDVLLTTENENIPTKVGTLVDYRNNNHIVIKTLHSMLADGLFISGNFIVNFDDEENFQSFISELKKNNIEVTQRDVGLDSEAKLPLEIIIIAGYLILILLIYFQVHSSKEKYVVKKLLGYSNRAIWFEDIKDFIVWNGCILILFQICISLVIFKEINIFFIEIMMKLVVIGLGQLLGIILMIYIAHLQLRSFNFIYALKQKNDSIKSMIFNRVIKTILSIVLINLILLTGQNLKITHSTYSSSLKPWLNVKDYVVLPVIEGIENEYLVSNDFREKQVELYKVFNENGSIYAEFNKYSRLYESKKWEIEDIISTYCIVNPNYLMMNKLYDENNELITLEECDEDYILIVPEKYKQVQSEILSNHNRYKLGVKSDEKKSNQNIRIIWSKNNQKIFSYDLDINPEEGNMVEDPIIKVLTESNGLLSDYDRILGYKGNPVKIKIAGNNAYDYIYTTLNQHHLDQYIPSYYKIYDYILPEIESTQNLMIYCMIGLVLICFIIIVLIYQNVCIFFQVNKKKIVVKKITGHGIFSKYNSIFMYYLIEWTSIIIILTNTVTRELLWESIIFLMLMELLVYSFYVMQFEKKTIVKFLKGGE